MQYRQLGKTGLRISEISLGTWQVGGGWGQDFDEAAARRILETAIDRGVNFFDTADVYSGGASERTLGKVIRESKEKLYLATKCGRKLSPHEADSYTPEAMLGFVEDSLSNTGLDCLDLVQLHCPPTDVYYRPEIFETFDRLKEAGKIANLGVSVEKVEEALKAAEYENVASVQIIYNMFRQRPRERFFDIARERDIGVIVRVPLASGLLTGKMSRQTVFSDKDHRRFNRNGAYFDRGETFAGIDYEIGLEAVEELQKLLPDNQYLSAVALRWILTDERVSCIIPGASRPEQVEQNVAAAEIPALSSEQLRAIDEIYERYIKPSVHQRW
jgi:aryl-alcohol dehydrogenase-like predicted oxidoreductase